MLGVPGKVTSLEVLPNISHLAIDFDGDDSLSDPIEIHYKTIQVDFHYAIRRNIGRVSYRDTETAQSSIDAAAQRKLSFSSLGQGKHKIPAGMAGNILHNFLVLSSIEAESNSLISINNIAIQRGISVG